MVDVEKEERRKGADTNERVDGYRAGRGRAGATAKAVSHGCSGSRSPKRNGIRGGIP